MATFSESQITDLAEIFDTNSETLADHLEFYASVITESDKTAVLARITDFQAVEDNDTSIEPNVRNFGARINSNSKRALIRKRIAALLSWTLTGSGSRLVRC